MMTGLSAKIDRELCVGAGACIETAPEGFEFDDEHIAVVRPEAEQEPDGKLLRWRANARRLAILIYDDDGKEVDIVS